MPLPPAYVISCPELGDRMEACAAHLGERGVAATFWRSIHGKTAGLATTHEFEPGKTISPGHVGLHLGHLSLWQHLSFKLWDYNDEALIFEDDVVLPEDFAEQVDKVRAELAVAMPDWDFVLLGTADSVPAVWDKITERVGDPTGRLCRMAWPWGTHAILLRRKALPTLIDRMQEVRRNIDQQLYKQVLEPNLLKWCACVPSIAHQRTHDYKGTGKTEWAPSTIDGPAPLTEDDGKGNVPERVLLKSMDLVDPYPCIFRGEPLEDDAVSEGGYSVPVSQCARFNQPCHSKSVVVADALACETCPCRKQMSPMGARPRLDVPDGHFNPSMVMFNGRLILATRDSWGHSKVALWELFNSAADWTGTWRASLISSLAARDPRAPRLEDPRLFVTRHPDTNREVLNAAFNLPDGYPPKVVRVGHAVFSPDLDDIDAVEVFPSPRNSVYEKNWVPFVYAGETHWVYATLPEHVVLGPYGATTKNPFPWTGGACRGGASPVLHEGAFYHFFHGALKRPEGTVYTVGCVVFEKYPPFRVLRQTVTPLIWPDLPAPNESVKKRYVVFPGGAVHHAGAWHIVAGIDDTYSRIFRVTDAELAAAMTREPPVDAPRVVSIRDTVMVTGITA